MKTGISRFSTLILMHLFLMRCIFVIFIYDAWCHAYISWAKSLRNYGIWIWCYFQDQVITTYINWYISWTNICHIYECILCCKREKRKICYQMILYLSIHDIAASTNPFWNPFWFYWLSKEKKTNPIYFSGTTLWQYWYTSYVATNLHLDLSILFPFFFQNRAYFDVFITFKISLVISETSHDAKSEFPLLLFYCQKNSSFLLISII